MEAFVVEDNSWSSHDGNTHTLNLKKLTCKHKHTQTHSMQNKVTKRACRRLHNGPISTTVARMQTYKNGVDFALHVYIPSESHKLLT